MRLQAPEDDTDVGAAVGATLAAALLFGLLAGCGCLWCFYRRRKQKAAYDSQAQDPYMQSASPWSHSPRVKQASMSAEESSRCVQPCDVRAMHANADASLQCEGCM